MVEKTQQHEWLENRVRILRVMMKSDKTSSLKEDYQTCLRMLKGLEVKYQIRVDIDKMIEERRNYGFDGVGE